MILKLINSAILASCLYANCVYANNPVSASVVEQHLAAGSALVVDLETDEVLYADNEHFVAPIASITKLLTAMVVIDAEQDLKERLPIVIEETPEMEGVFSRVRLGSKLSRHDLLLITLMASENRAAASLAHHYPGGYAAFIKAMNAKAQALGMTNSAFIEPTGLSEHNVSSARDLVLLITAADDYPLIRKFSTLEKQTMVFSQPRYSLDFRNTNYLVRKHNWHIELSKTGFTNKAGHCLVMITEMDERPVAFVVLDTFGKYTHIADANRLKKWLETGAVTPVPVSALNYKHIKQQQRKERVTTALTQ